MPRQGMKEGLADIAQEAGSRHYHGLVPQHPDVGPEEVTGSRLDHVLGVYLREAHRRPDVCPGEYTTNQGTQFLVCVTAEGSRGDTTNLQAATFSPM